MSNVIIKVNNLKKRFLVYDQPSDKLKEVLFKKNIGKEFWAVKGVSFSIQHGESVGIIGLNGSGKSTLLQMIVGTLNPTEGTCEVYGRISALLELGAGFNPEYTGIENVYLNGSILGLSKSEIEEKLESIIDFADIGEHVYQPVKTYSSGMFVRLAFAVAAHVDPDVLIVDEALSVGDVLFQQKCFAYINGQLKDKTKLFVTHDFATLSLVAERSIVLMNGEIAFDGPTKEAIKCYNKLIHQSSNLNVEKDDKSTKTDSAKKADVINDYVKFNNDVITGLNDFIFTDYLIKIQGRQDTIVHHDDDVSVTLKVKKINDVNIIGKPVVGFFFRDKFGQQVFGQNTLSLDESFVISDESKIVFNFQWPRVKTGEYTLTVGLGFVNKENDIVHDVQCWCNDFSVFSCVTPHIEHGVFNLPISKFEVQ